MASFNAASVARYTYAPVGTSSASAGTPYWNALALARRRMKVDLAPADDPTLNAAWFHNHPSHGPANEGNVGIQVSDTYAHFTTASKFPHLATALNPDLSTVGMAPTVQSS